jgi:hypothetical protein
MVSCHGASAWPCEFVLSRWLRAHAIRPGFPICDRIEKSLAARITKGLLQW